MQVINGRSINGKVRSDSSNFAITCVVICHLSQLSSEKAYYTKLCRYLSVCMLHQRFAICEFLFKLPDTEHPLLSRRVAWHDFRSNVGTCIKTQPTLRVTLELSKASGRLYSLLILFLSPGFLLPQVTIQRLRDLSLMIMSPNPYWHLLNLSLQSPKPSDVPGKTKIVLMCWNHFLQVNAWLHLPF